MLKELMKPVGVLLAIAASAAAMMLPGTMDGKPAVHNFKHEAKVELPALDEQKSQPAPAPAPVPTTVTISLPVSLTGEIGDILSLPATTTALNVRWIVSDAGLQMIPVTVLKDSKTAVLIGKKPGVYRVWAYAAVGDMPTDPAMCTVQIAGSVPPIPPNPPTPPNPPNPPTPPVAKTLAFVMAIVDHSKLTPAQGEILVSSAAPINAKGHKWRELEVTNQVIKDRAYTTYVTQAGGPPMVLIVDFNNKVLKAAPFPADQAGMMKLVTDVTGN